LISPDERKCIKCNVPMKKTFVNYNGVKFEARQCPHCKEKIFTEELTMKAIAALESKRLEKEYVKRPVKIGHSLGFIFPKDVTDVFNIDGKKKLRLIPNVAKGRIEIAVE
jgi:hypothetical protein